MIQAENLTAVRRADAVRGHLLQDQPPKGVGLVGRNGYGKITLFRLIVGQEELDEGLISIPCSCRTVTSSTWLHCPDRLPEAALSLPGSADDFWRVEKILAGLGFGRPTGRSTYRAFRRIPSPFEPGQGPLGRSQHASPGRAEQLPRHHLDPLAEKLNAWPGELIPVTHDRSFMDKVVTHTLAIHRRKVKNRGDHGQAA